MELITKRIHTNQMKCRSDIQLTLEDDINVPDSRPDIDHIIKVQGEIQIQDTTPEEDRVLIRGQLSFSLLYLSTEDLRPVHTMHGQIPFEETINMENTVSNDEIHCHFDLEDCRASLINSRKVSVRAILSLHCCQDETDDLAAGTNIISEDAARAEMEHVTPPEGLHQRFQTMQLTTMALQKKDIFRIKDETTLPKGKPNAEELLYYEITPQSLLTRLVDDGVRITGDLLVFVLYTPEDDERTLEYFETELPFDGIVTCHGCSEEMIADVEITPGKKQFEFKQDEDGENRILDLEMILNMEMKFYQEEELEYLEDAYSTSCELELTKEQAHAEKLLMKNQSSVRISDRIKVTNENEHILQICNATGTIQIDEQTITEDGIQLDGVVELDLLYITEDDVRPLSVLKGTIPFSHLIEVRGIRPEDNYELQTDINSINVIMLDSEEIEAKLVLSLGVLVFTRLDCEVITAIRETPLDLQKFQEMPGLVGYIVKTGDTLWSIAKEFNTTVESIMELNQLDNDIIHRGDKLLLLKQADGIL